MIKHHTIRLIHRTKTPHTAAIAGNLFSACIVIMMLSMPGDAVGTLENPHDNGAQVKKQAVAQRSRTAGNCYAG